MAPTTASILTVLFIVICDVHSRAVQPDSASPAAAESPSGEYRFNYNISEAHSRDVKSHSESSDGAEITGTYRILQPDGCIRVVRYTAGTMGFQPTVTYEGDGCQPADSANDSADNRLTGTGPEDSAEQDPSQKSMDETSISEDLKSLTMDILDALIPVHDPVETTAMPVDDVVTETPEDSITVDSSSADPVVLPSDNVITPMDVHPAQFRSQPIPESDTTAEHKSLAKTELEPSAEDAVAEPDSSDETDVPKEATARCWSTPKEPEPEHYSPVSIEKIPASEVDDAIHVLPAYYYYNPWFYMQLRKASDSAPVVTSPSALPPNFNKNLRTYVIRTPSSRSSFNLFRKHPKLVPYRIKEVRMPEQGIPHPPGRIIRPIAFPASR